jgi:hypothetical protein
MHGGELTNSHEYTNGKFRTKPLLLLKGVENPVEMIFIILKVK